VRRRRLSPRPLALMRAGCLAPIQRVSGEHSSSKEETNRDLLFWMTTRSSFDHTQAIGHSLPSQVNDPRWDSVGLTNQLETRAAGSYRCSANL
jgi:hypothetical protein